MTSIEFWFNATDKVDYACRLVRKAARSNGAQLVLTGDSQTLDAIDAAMWQLSPTDFLAHCHADAPQDVISRSPVVLASSGSALPDRPLLINLAREVPAGFERFERLIEFVASDDEDREAGRNRWRHYAHRGYAIERKDLAGAAA